MAHLAMFAKCDANGRDATPWGWGWYAKSRFAHLLQIRRATLRGAVLATAWKKDCRGASEENGSEGD
jgi:hypothetical protein